MARTKHEEASIRGQSWVSASYVPPIAVLGVAAFIRPCHRMLSIRLIEIMDDTGLHCKICCVLKIQTNSSKDNQQNKEVEVSMCSQNLHVWVQPYVVLMMWQCKLAS